MQGFTQWQCSASRRKRFHEDEEWNPLDRCNHSSLVTENAKKPHKEAYLVQTVKRKSHGGLPGDRGTHMDLPRVYSCSCAHLII
jgi:hypothetical protein